MSWMKDGREATAEEVTMMNDALSNPHHGWFEFWCGHCEKLIMKMHAYRFNGGWTGCLECGHETLFSPSTSTGKCQAIQVRLANRANGISHTKAHPA